LRFDANIHGQIIDGIAFFKFQQEVDVLRFLTFGILLCFGIPSCLNVFVVNNSVGVCYFDILTVEALNNLFE
jgi:hypothetical protein